MFKLLNKLYCCRKKKKLISDSQIQRVGAQHLQSEEFEAVRGTCTQSAKIRVPFEKRQASRSAGV